MKRASYRAGLWFIALNDEPLDMDPASVAGYVSVQLLSELFNVPAEKIGRDVVRYRKQQSKREECQS